MTNNTFSRRAFALGAIASAGAVAACGNGVGSRGSGMIDARVDATLNAMYRSFPNTRQLAEKSNGMLIMPLVTEAGLGFGGAYGRGALRVNNVTVDYYSVTKATGGLQIGAQQYAKPRSAISAALPVGLRVPIWNMSSRIVVKASKRIPQPCLPPCWPPSLAAPVCVSVPRWKARNIRASFPKQSARSAPSRIGQLWA